MIQKIKDFFSLFNGSPNWVRYVVSVIMAVLFTLWLLTSCGQTVKVTVRDTPTGVSVTTSQNKQDSSNTSISVNPNIHFNGNKSAVQ